MHKLLICLLASVWFVITLSAQPISIASLRKILVKWTSVKTFYFNNHVLSATDKSQLQSKSDELVMMLKNTFPDFRGAEYRTWIPISDPLLKGWPPSYSTTLYVFQFQVPERQPRGMNVFKHSGISTVDIMKNHTPYFIPVRLREFLPAHLLFVREQRKKELDAFPGKQITPGQNSFKELVQSFNDDQLIKL